MNHWGAFVAKIKVIHNINQHYKQSGSIFASPSGSIFAS